MDIPSIRADLRFALETAASNFMIIRRGPTPLMLALQTSTWRSTRSTTFSIAPGRRAFPRASFTAISRVIFLFLALKRWSLRVVCSYQYPSVLKHDNHDLVALGLGGCNAGHHAQVQRGARERVDSRLRDHARHVGACAVPTHVGFAQSLADNWKSVKWLFSTSAPLSAVMKEKILADTSAQLLSSMV